MQDVQTYYDEVAPRYARLLPDLAHEAPFDLAVLDHVLSLLPAGAAVLDAGCGAGRLIERLAGSTRDVRGVDLSPGMIAQARARFPGVPLEVADLRHLPFAAGAFDGVVSWYSIIHAAEADRAAMVAELARVLRAGGVLLLAFQAGSGPRSTGGYGGDASAVAYLHRTADVEALVVAAGLESVVVAERAARPSERHPQGFVAGRRPT